MLDQEYELADSTRWILGVVMQYQLDLKHPQQNPFTPKMLRP